MNNLNSCIQDNHLNHNEFKLNSVRNKKVLVVDGNRESQQETETLMVSEGFEVTLCNDGIAALQEAKNAQFQLILIDIVISNFNGFELLKKLRSNIKTPVMILSSQYDIFDKIYALEIGADDYLIKPVNRRELLARINAINRRTSVACNLQTNEKLNVSNISLCLSTREVHCSGQLLNLTGYEFEVLHFLMLNAGKVVSKDKIGEFVHGRVVPYYDRSIDMHISNIRKKLSAIIGGQKIKTVRGAGYVFVKDALYLNAVEST